MERMKELVKKLNEAVGAYYNSEQEMMPRKKSCDSVEAR